MTKPIIVVKVPCKLLYVIQVKEFLIKCSTSWPYLISEFLVAYITIVASDWPRTFFTPKVFLFSIQYTINYYPNCFKLYEINKSPTDTDKSPVFLGNILVITQAFVLCLYALALRCCTPSNIMDIYQVKHSCLCSYICTAVHIYTHTHLYISCYLN